MQTNPVANWFLPVNTTQDATTYKNNLDSAAAVAQRYVDNFAPHQSPQTADMTVTLDTGHIFNGLALSEVGADFGTGLSGTFTNSSTVVTGIPSTARLQAGMNILISTGGFYSGLLPVNSTIVSVDSSSQIHISGTGFTGTTGTQSFVAYPKSAVITAPVSHPRIDRVVIDKISGTVAVVTGSEATSPVPPAIPAYCCPVAQVLLQTSSTSILNNMITDERDFSGLGGAGGQVAGASAGLALDTTGNTTASAAADEFVVKSALGGGALTLYNVSLSSLNCAGTGANGLDNGSLASNTFYYIYVIYNPATQTAALLATAAVSGNGAVYAGSHMPAGYTMSGLAGILLTNGSAHFVTSFQVGREVFYSGLQTIFTAQANVSALTSQSVAAAVPPMAKTASGILTGVPISSVNCQPTVAATSGGTAQQRSSSITTSTVTGLAGLEVDFRLLPLLTSQTLYWDAGNTSGSNSGLYINSYTF